jgi:hypothetical protein
MLFIIMLSAIVMLLLLAITFIVAITIQGKMAGGMTRVQAWKQLIKEIFLRRG